MRCCCCCCSRFRVVFLLSFLFVADCWCSLSFDLYQSAWYVLPIAAKTEHKQHQQQQQQPQPETRREDMIQFMPMESVICVACRYISAVCMIVWAVLWIFDASISVLPALAVACPELGRQSVRVLSILCMYKIYFTPFIGIKVWPFRCSSSS